MAVITFFFASMPALHAQWKLASGTGLVYRVAEKGSRKFAGVPAAMHAAAHVAHSAVEAATHPAGHQPETVAESIPLSGGGGQYAGGGFDWLTPFNLMVGACMLGGYALLGATWLIMKTEGPLQGWAYGQALTLAVLIGIGMALVSASTPCAISPVFVFAPSSLPRRRSSVR